MRNRKMKSHSLPEIYKGGMDGIEKFKQIRFIESKLLEYKLEYGAKQISDLTDGERSKMSALICKIEKCKLEDSSLIFSRSEQEESKNA